MGAGGLRLTGRLGAAGLALAVLAGSAFASIPPPPREEVVAAIRKASCPDARQPAHFTEVAFQARPLERSEGPEMRLDRRVRFLGGLEIRSADPRLGRIAALTLTGHNGDLMGVTRDGAWLKLGLQSTKEWKPVGLEFISAAPMLDAEGAPVAAAGLAPSGVGHLYPGHQLVSFDQPGGVRLYDFADCGPAARAVEHFRLDTDHPGPVAMTFGEYSYAIFTMDGPQGLIAAFGRGLRFEDASLAPERLEIKPQFIAPLPGYRLTALHNPSFLAWDVLALWRGEGVKAGETRVQEMDLVDYLHFARQTARPPRDLVTVTGRPFRAIYGFRTGVAREKAYFFILSDNSDAPDRPVMLLAFMVESPPPARAR